MMKKSLIALTAVCLLLAPSFYANADVLVEPENEFYSLHKSQIVYLGRSFSASGARGELARLQNGEKVYLQYSCLYDGVYAWPTANGSQSSAIEEAQDPTTADATGVPELQDDPEPQDAVRGDEDSDIYDYIITIVAVLIIATTLLLTALRRKKASL